MASRVSVDITARDLTRNELVRMRQNFRRTGQDLERMVTARTRQNFERLQQSLRSTRSDMTRLRGAIPDQEFFRLDTAVRNAQRNMRGGFGRTTVAQLNSIERQVRDVTDAFRDLDRAGDIDVRIDTSALQRADRQLDAWRRQQQRNGVRIQVRPQVNARGFRQRLIRTLTSPVRTAGSFLGGLMEDGLGQGILNAFKTAGPVGVAILAGIIASSISLIGAALSGLLVFGIGAAMVGLGVLIAKQTGQMKDMWREAVADIKDSFRDVATPLLPSIQKALDLAMKLAADFAPALKRAFADATPFLNEFLGKFDSGLRKMGKAAFEPLMQAFDVFLLAFGPQLEGFLEELGKAFGALARTVENNSIEIAVALRVVLNLIVFLVDVINFLANAWVEMFHGFLSMVAQAIDGWATFVDAVLSGVGRSLTALGFLGQAIPGIGNRINDARDAFNLFKERSVTDLRSTADSVRGLSQAIKDQNRRNVLRVDITQLENKINVAKEKLRSVKDVKARAKIQADIDQLLAAKARALVELNSLNGRVATTYITTVHRTTEENVSKFAKGGIRGAATGGARGNMTLVGEQGPELVNLQPGSHVRSNSDTRRLMAGAAAGNGGISQIVIKSSGRRTDDLLLEILRDAIHQRGGNPVTVLGG